MQNKLKVALIGFGGMGHFHATQYADQPNAQLIAIVDKDPETFKRSAQKINIGDSGEVSLKGIPQYTSYEEMMAKETPDVLDICLPCDLHAEYAIRAMKDGLHVLCEKPMARTAKDAKRMIAVSKKMGKRLMIAQCLRFDPVYATFRKLHESGKYGKLLRITAQRLAKTATGSDRWYRDGKRSGGALLDLHLHDVDYFLDLFGKLPKSVSSQGVTRASGEIDEVFTRYDFGNGVQASAGGSWLHGFWHCELSAVYEKATIHLEGNKVTVYDAVTQEPKEYEIQGKKNGYWEEIAYFTKGILRKTPFAKCEPESTCNTIRLAEAEKASVLQNAAPVKP